MKRAAALVAASMAAAIFFAVPAQAEPVCHDPVGACDTLCRWGIVC